jgi:predicted GNAT superfamily acetyltransferase
VRHDVTERAACQSHPVTTLSPGRVDEARTTAERAAQRSGVTIGLLHQPIEHHEAADLLREIWRSPASERPVAPELLRAIRAAGGYVAGARLDGLLIAASVGLLGRSDGRPYLHSHISGVRAGVADRSVGRAVKLHQRAWAIEQGLAEIRWTFDPLVRRNAYFNVSVLGASIVAYHPAYYGPMADGINDGDETDRVVASWDMSQATTAGPIEPVPHGPDAAMLRADETGAPVLCEGIDGVRLLSIPEDIVELRRRDPALALRWRYALRDAMQQSLGTDQYRVTAVMKDGWYVLTKG